MERYCTEGMWIGWLLEGVATLFIIIGIRLIYSRGPDFIFILLVGLILFLIGGIILVYIYIIKSKTTKNVSNNVAPTNIPSQNNQMSDSSSEESIQNLKKIVKVNHLAWRTRKEYEVIM